MGYHLGKTVNTMNFDSENGLKGEAYGFVWENEDFL